jgi:hypothetical protein
MTNRLAGVSTSRGAPREDTAYRASKYVASADLRSAFEYDAFETSKAGQASNARDGSHHHSGWLLKRYSGDGPEVQWKRRWFYLLDDRL